MDSRSLPLFLVWFVLLDFSFLCCVLYLSLFVLLSFFLCCLSFNLWILITTLVSSNSFLHIKSISYLIKTSSLGKGCSYILFNCTVIPVIQDRTSLGPSFVFGIDRCSEQRFSTLGLYLILGLYRNLVDSGFGLDMFHCIYQHVEFN